MAFKPVRAVAGSQPMIGKQPLKKRLRAARLNRESRGLASHITLPEISIQDPLWFEKSGYKSRQFDVRNIS